MILILRFDEHDLENLMIIEFNEHEYVLFMYCIGLGHRLHFFTLPLRLLL